MTTPPTEDRDWKERFKDDIGINTDFTNGEYEMLEVFIEKEITTAEARAIRPLLLSKRKLLEDYSRWLHKKGYIDADYYAEEPHAIDAYLESLS